jgi:GDP-L-fucose synthase
MVGSAILRNLELRGFTNFVFTPYPEYDLTNQKIVEDFFCKERPEYVIDAAAKVGGILANDTYRAQFIYENLMIQNNIIHNAHVFGVKKLLFLGSSCIYPKNCPQPMKEEYLLTGLLEPTNEPYAIAKIAGIKMCENYYRQYGSNFISVMPTNLFGPNDNFNLQTSHVLPALIRKFYLAKCLSNNEWDLIRLDFDKRPINDINGRANKEKLIEVLFEYGIYINNSHQKEDRQSTVVVTLWGTGVPKREFLHVDDMADACVHLLKNSNANKLYSKDITHINIGSGIDLSIKELAIIITEIVDYKGEIEFDPSKPDGTMRKLLNVSRLNNLGWHNRMDLKTSINLTYNWYIATSNS